LKIITCYTEIFVSNLKIAVKYNRYGMTLYKGVLKLTKVYFNTNAPPYKGSLPLQPSPLAHPHPTTPHT